MTPRGIPERIETLEHNVGRLERENAALREAATKLLAHMDRSPLGETQFERDVIHMRNVVERMDHYEFKPPSDCGELPPAASTDPGGFLSLWRAASAAIDAWHREDEALLVKTMGELQTAHAASDPPPTVPARSTTPPEPGWRRAWYCGRCDKDTPTNEDGKCPVCTKYKVLPPPSQPGCGGSGS